MSLARKREETAVNRQKLFLILIVTAILLASCEPTITVANNTQIMVRVVVRTGGRTEVVSPSPGESSTVEAAEGGYSVSVIPDAEWIEYAKLTRQYLNDQLANADKLTGPQLLDVIRRLKDIALRMQQYEQAAGSAARCGGRVTEDSLGFVVIRTAADGKLVASCK